MIAHCRGASIRVDELPILPLLLLLLLLLLTVAADQSTSLVVAVAVAVVAILLLLIVLIPNYDKSISMLLIDAAEELIVSSLLSVSNTK